MDGRVKVTFLSSVVGDVDISSPGREISGVLGILRAGVSDMGREDIEDSFEMEILSSSISNAEVSDSWSASAPSGVLSRVRVRPRLYCI